MDAASLVIIGGAVFLLAVFFAVMAILGYAFLRPASNTFLGFKVIPVQDNLELVTPAWYRIAFCLYLVAFSVFLIQDAFTDPNDHALFILAIALVLVTARFCYRNYQIIRHQKN